MSHYQEWVDVDGRPQVHVDFNEVHSVLTTRYNKVVGTWVAGLHLRQAVRAVDGDGEWWGGWVCGFLDFGRGSLVLVELDDNDGPHFEE